jgi:translation initiation factor IF-1
MPKNTFGGNKAKKGRKNTTSQVREIEYVVEEGESYGVVQSLLGDQRFMVQLITDTARGEAIMCHISNGHKRRLGFVKVNDHVLIAIRQNSGKKKIGDIIFLYKPDEVQFLLSRGEIIDVSISSSAGVSVDTGYTFTSGTREESTEVGAGAVMSSRVKGAATEINIDSL